MFLKAIIAPSIDENLKIYFYSPKNWKISITLRAICVDFIQRLNEILTLSLFFYQVEKIQRFIKTKFC